MVEGLTNGYQDTATFDYHAPDLTFSELLKEDDIDLSILDIANSHAMFPDIFNPTETSNTNTEVFSLPFTTDESFVELLGSKDTSDSNVVPQFSTPLAPVLPLMDASGDGNFGPFTSLPTSCPPIASRPTEILPNPGGLRFAKPGASRMPMMVQTDGRIYEIIEQQFEPNPTYEQTMAADTKNLYLRWFVPPPDRVHATSPSRLMTHPRPGTRFDCGVQLCAHCPTLGKYIPYTAEKNITLSACIYGKRKPKTGANKSNYNDYYMRRSDYVKLTTNPTGAPLLLSSDSAIVDITIKKGESKANFNNLSLTCGSNAARSRKALPAARGWDWDYHLLIRCTSEDVCVHSLMSKHLTTDSNRSQTREKRKLSEAIPKEQNSPSPKRRKLSDSSSGSDTQESSSSDDDVRTSTSEVSFRCNTVKMQTFSNVISKMKSELFK